MRIDFYRYTITDGPAGGKYFTCRRCGFMQWVHESAAKYPETVVCICEKDEYHKEMGKRRRERLWNDPNRPH